MTETECMTDDGLDDPGALVHKIRRAGVGIFVREDVSGSQTSTEGRRSEAPLLLLHGLGLDHQAWGPVADRLAGEGRRVIRIDLRGHGRSDAPSTGFGLGDLVADTLAVLDELDIPAAHVVGHSLGGTIGLQLALMAPERVRSVTVLGALVAGQTPPPSFMAWAGQLFELLQQGLPAVLDVLPDTAPYQVSDPDLALEVRRVAGSSLHAPSFLPENFTDLQVAAETPPTQWDRMRSGGLQCPLLTIDGSYDPVVAGVLEPTQAGTPHARGIVLPGAGHLALLEQSDTVASHLRQFVHDAENMDH